MPLHVVEQTDRDLHLALSGRLDNLGVTDVEERLLEFAAAGKPTIVDLSEVNFISSMGLGMLAAVARTLEKHGALLVLLRPQELVDKILRIANLPAVMPIARDLEEARTLIASRPSGGAGPATPPRST